MRLLGALRGVRPVLLQEHGACGLWHPGSSHLLKMPARAVVGRARHCHTAEETKYILVPIRKAYSDMLPFHTDR